jgi:hypothetical protein
VNKRIQALAEQAGILKEQSVKAKIVKNEDGTWTSILEYPDLEKFAKLILRECINVCEPVLDEPYEDMSEFGKGLVEGQDVAVEKIRQHFGVEE